jgi:alpha-aminoadipic semialdehyde synthase
MGSRIGIRREDKNEWETRVPLTPLQVKALQDQGLAISVQSSPVRTFADQQYQELGATVTENLGDCKVVIAVKEMPLDFFEPGKTYMFFSHVIKGQDYNMPMLQRLIDRGCTLIDYEVITDDAGRRLVFFGRHAGLAGMIDSLWAFGKRLESEGHQTPFCKIKLAHQYDNLEDAKTQIAGIGDEIRAKNLPDVLTPLVCGFTGYGNVSLGAQEIFDLLPSEEISPKELASLAERETVHGKLYKVVFKEEHLAEPLEPGHTFKLQDYYDHPEKYRSQFEQHLPHLSLLINCIYWTPAYPRLVTIDYLKRAFGNGQQPTLRVIGDISCDVGGSIECMLKVTEPGNPVYVYDPIAEKMVDGWLGQGPVIMAVDNLPCELPQESSEFFGQVLSPFVPALAAADFSRPFVELELPNEILRAVILYQGKLTPKFQYLQEHLDKQTAR